MVVKRFLPVLLALALCCAGAACSQPAAPPAPSGLSEPPVTPAASEDPASRPEEGEKEEEKEDTAMEPLYVADAARYRGTVAAMETDVNGEVTYRLTAFPGSGLAEQLVAAFTDSSRTSFDPATIREGDHLEVFYHSPGGDGCALTACDVIAANRLLPAEAVYYNGILVERQEQEDGSVDLVMVPLDTPPESRQDPMLQFVFHTGEDTRFRLSPEALTEGAELNIYHRGISTRSIPPQGAALEVQPFR